MGAGRSRCRPSGGDGSLDAMGRVRNGVLAWIAAAAVVVVVGTARAADEKAKRIEYRDDRLTVRVEQMPINDLLTELARQSGAEIAGSPREDRQITVDFEQLPVVEGLQRILATQNFTLRYGEGGRLRLIQLLGGPQTARLTPPTTVPATQPTQGQANCGNVMVLLQQVPAQPASPRLAQALATSSVSLPQLLDAAMHQNDAGIRADAMRAWLNAVESNAELRAAVVCSLNATDDATLTQLIRGGAGAHAEELVLQVATQARSSELRVKGSALLKALRATPAGG